MGMAIRTEIFPLRASLRKKDTWDLRAEVQNEDANEKMVTVRIELPPEANFSTVGLNNFFEKNVENFRPNSTAQFRMQVHLSKRAREGNFMGRIKVMEHFHDFDHVERTYSKDIPFRIVE